MPVPTDLTGPILIPSGDTPIKVIAALHARLIQGVDPNAVNPILGKLPLCEVRVAAEGQGVDVVRWLLQHGARPDAVDRHKNTALHHYLYYRVDDAMIAAVLAAEPDLTLRNAAGYTPLDVAAERNLPQWIAPLVAAGADPNAAHPVTGSTPLHRALSSGLGATFSRLTVLRLLDAGANHEALDAQGRTPDQACPVQPCPGWAAIRVVLEQRALRVALEDALTMSVAEADPAGSPVDLPGRERRRLLIDVMSMGSNGALGLPSSVCG